MSDLERLSKQVDNLLAEHELARHNFEEDATELAAFLRGYYARVVPVLDPEAEVEDVDIHPQSDARNRARRLYATLMKSYHPDTQDSISATADLLAEIHQAYRDVNILALERLVIKTELANRNMHEQVNFLWKKSMALAETTAIIKSRHAEMRASAEYDLYRKHFDAMDLGVDLAEAVISNLSF